MEPIKVFLDTNVVLDYFTGRMNNTYATQIIQVGRSQFYQLCISFLTAANVMYCGKKYASGITAKDLTALFTILPQDMTQWDKAAAFGLDDFEDSLQLACALDAGCACMVSRDRHFIGVPIPLFDPVDFLDTVVRNFAP